MLLKPLACLFALLLSVEPAAAAPRRIVSMNPCVDAILRDVAAPGQIAGISHYSRDPRATSVPLDWAARYPVNHDTAEEVLALRPDLVIASSHTAPATRHAIERAGAPLLLIGVPNSLNEVRGQVRAIGDAAEQPARARRLIAAIDAAEQAARTDRRPVPALLRQGWGLTPGRGTLIDSMMRASGFRNASADYGLKQWDILSLERLASDPPAVLLTDARDEPRALAHPIFRRLGARIALRDFPDRLLRCGGPTVIAALERLTAIRRSLD